MLRDHGPDDGAGLLAHAMARKVVPVSPHTFYAYLLVILHGLFGSGRNWQTIARWISGSSNIG
jgi:pimeloyl-ACP methyl ester carboxylesterase